MNPKNTMYSKKNFDIIELLKKNRFLINSLLTNIQNKESNNDSAVNKTGNHSTQKIKTKSQ